MTQTTQNHQQVDSAEIARFEKIAADWWNPTGKFRPLHDMNPHRLHLIAQHCQIHSNRFLDIGCGGGLVAEKLRYQGANVVGIDLSTTAIEVAKKHAADNNLTIDYRLCGIEQIVEAKEQFDHICCMELLEHVPNPASMVAHCYDLLKPGGKVFFSTINRNPKAFAFAIIGAEYILQLLPKGTHSYQKFIKPSELHNFCEKVHLDVIDIVGLTYNPVTKNFRLGQDVAVNYFLIAQKPNR